MVKRSIEQNLRMKNFEARNGNSETSAVVKNQRMKHDKDKRAKSTQPNPSPRSSTQQNMKNASGTKSPRGRSPSGKMAPPPCKDYLKGTCTTPFCDKWHPPECLWYKTENWCKFGDKCSYAHRQVEEQPSKRSKKNGDKNAVAMLKSTRQRIHDKWVASVRIWSRRSLQRFCRRAQTYWSQSDVFDSPKPCYVTPTFETKNHRLE